MSDSFTVGLGGNQALVNAVSLAVPLCAVLGVQKVSLMSDTSCPAVSASLNPSSAVSPLFTLL
jgi:hypothetical protein